MYLAHNDLHEASNEILTVSLVNVLQRTARRNPDQGIYHVAAGTEEFQTYADLLATGKRMAQLFYRKGLRPGDRLILAVESSRNFLEVFWGCLIAGIIPAPLSHMRTPRAESMEARKIFQVWQALDAPVVVDAGRERAYGVLSELLAGARLLVTEDLVDEARITDHRDEDFHIPKNEDIAVLQFSSGSTGMPKGARLTHRNLIANIVALRNLERVEKGDVLVSWLPYFHDFGLFGCHLMPLYAGISQVKMDAFQFAQRPFHWMQKIHEHRATHTSSTNTGIEHLLAYMDIRGKRLPEVDLSSLKVLTLGAEMVSPDACRRIEEKLGPMGLARNVVMPGYGLTETTLVATCHPNGVPVKTFLVNRDRLVREGVVQRETDKTADTAEFVSVGPCVDFCRVRIVDGQGNPLPPNRVGVVEIQGDNVIAGYQDNPEADAEAFHGDWFSSGDMGFVDDTGCLCIVGREKEIIIVRGQNHYPADVEHIAIEGHEDKFRLVVACGIHDPAEGREKVLLFYVRNNQKLTCRNTAATLAAMNGNLGDLAGFTIDHFIPMTQAEIPRTSSGKVMRKALAAAYLNGEYADKIRESDALVAACAREIPVSEIDHEEMVRRIWGEVLGIDGDRVDPHKSLFKLGGDSIRAMRIQGRLEDAYRAKMESGFCYLFPTVATQTNYFQHRDFSIEPPQNELEVIVQKVVAEKLGVKTDSVGVTENILQRLSSVSEMMEIVREIRRVFAEAEIGEDFFRLGTIRGMAEYLHPKVFTGGDREAAYDIFPLMHFQETLYFHRKGFVRNEPSGLSCYIFLNARMNGPLDAGIFDKALNGVVRRHPVLRSIIDEEDDRPRMKSLRQVPEVRVNLVDISALPEDEQREYVLQRGLEHNDHRFDLGAWPLFFCEMVKLGPDRHVFMMNIDHLLVDGFSYMQVFEELFNTYDRMLLDEPWELPEVPMTFGDYVRVEQLRQRTGEYRKALEFQLDIFRGLPPKALLPSKRNPASLEKVYFDTFYQEIEPEIIDALNAVAMRHQVSLNSVLLGAYFKLMNIWTHQDDLIINMPVFNREQYFAGARKTVASFIDIFPVRLQTHFGEPLMEIAVKADRFTRKLLEVPVSSIELSRNIFEREGLRATSMSSLIFSNSIGMYAGEVSGMRNVTLEAPEFRTGAPGTFIDLVIYDYRVRKDAADVYYFNWNYIRDLFDRDFIEILAGQYRALLEQIAALRDHEGDFPPFTGEDILPERHRRLMEEVNRTEHPIPDGTLHGLIAEQVARTPDATALTFGSDSLTYAEFDDLAGRVAGTLADLDIGKGDFAALFLGRSLDMLVGQLGVLKSGAAYLPIDIEYPAERVAYVLEDSRAPVLLTRSRHLAALEPSLGYVKTIVLLDRSAEAKDIPPSLADRIVMPDVVYRRRPPGESIEADPGDLAYMIYTSGSTGKPKGVMVTHRNIVNFLNWVKTDIGISSSERMALLTSYSFDMTLTSNWVPFLAGASLHVLSEEDTKDVHRLLRFLSEREITFLNVTPSHFSLIAHAREYLAGQDIPLREDMRVMLGGEVIGVRDLDLWLGYYPGHRFINEYGPTETTVASTFFPIPVNGENRVDLQTVPIGKPIHNTRVYILNKERKPCMVGVPGELCIGGAGVTRGYHAKPDRTAEAFVPNPQGEPGDILYRTGDVVRMRDDGHIEYLGRDDHQINLRGYRIEAGEIESALREHEGITEAAVVARKDTAESLVLVAFHTGPKGPVPAAELRAFLGRSLPSYMVPTHFEYLDKMPCTPSGKLDKAALPEVTVDAGHVRDEAERPTTELESRVAGIWEEVLGITGIGLRDNFWDVGGDSLKAMRLIMRMKKEGFIDFGLREAFEYQTVASIVEHILSRNAADSGEGDLVTLRSQSFPVARLFCLPYACGNPTMYRDLTALLPGDYAISAANIPGHETGAGLSDAAPMAVIDDIARHYADKLASPAGAPPLFLLGYSFGGHVAYEIARLLEQAGNPAAGVIVASSPPPGVKDGLRAILEGSDEEILRHSREVYGYDFTGMTGSEREAYFRILRVCTRAMLEFSFRRPLVTPAMVLTGRQEEEREIRLRAREWSEVFPNCEFREVEGAHMLVKTHTDDLARAISLFIDDLALKENGKERVK